MINLFKEDVELA
jgi:hypothetical protein